MLRLLHGPDCSSVSTFCTDNDLGSRVYIGIYRFSSYLPPTGLEGDIGMTMSACCPSHFWNFCAFADKLMIMGLHRPDELLVALCSRPAISWPLIIFCPLGQTNGEPPQPVFTSGHPPLNSHYKLLSCDILLHTHHWPDLPWTWQMNSLWASIDLIDFLPHYLIHLLE